MLVRETIARDYGYFHLVESKREGGRIRRLVIRALGRREILQTSGESSRSIAFPMCHSEQSVVLYNTEAGTLSCMRVCSPLLLGHLWKCLVSRDVVREVPDRRVSASILSVRCS